MRRQTGNREEEETKQKLEKTDEETEQILEMTQVERGKMEKEDVGEDGERDGAED
jgi:hypothetical protein